jgi:hypothetical protein
MPITFACLSCGKGYTVPDAMGGRRARCKNCQAMTNIPTVREAAAAGSHAGPAEDPFGAQWLGANGPTSPEALAQPQAVAQASPDGLTAGARVPAWARTFLARLDGVRPRKLWAWALVVVVLMLLVGFVDFRASLVPLVVLGGLGVLAIALAIAWSAVVALVLGSRVILALLVAAPATLGWVGVMKVVRRAERSAQGAALQQVTFGQVATGLAIVFGVFAIIAGLISNPRAFKRPFLLGAVGALLLGVCWLPSMFHARRASAASRDRQPPGYAAGRPPHVRPPEHFRDVPQRRPPRVAIPNEHPQIGRTTPTTPPPPAVVTRTPATPPRAANAARRDIPAPEPAAPQPLGGTVEVKWGGSWWPAKVIRQDRGWTQIEYDSGRTREWVEPWRMRAAGSRADDIPPVHSNATYGKPDAPAPAEAPGQKPAR